MSSGTSNEIGSRVLFCSTDGSTDNLSYISTLDCGISMRGPHLARIFLTVNIGFVDNFSKSTYVSLLSQGRLCVRSMEELKSEMRGLNFPTFLEFS